MSEGVIKDNSWYQVGVSKRRIEDLERQLSTLREESAGRMRRIEKLIKLCYEYDIPMEKVLDTGLDK